MARILDRMAADERAVVEQAAQLDDASGMDCVAETLAREWGASPSPAENAAHAAVPRRRILRVLALAAALLLAVYLWPSPRAGPGPGDVLLGSDRLQLTPLTSGLAVTGSISWTHPMPDGLGFRLRVLASTEDGRTLTLHETGRLDSMSWGDAEEIATWTATQEVMIEVEAIDASGQVVDSTSGTVRLQR